MQAEPSGENTVNASPGEKESYGRLRRLASLLFGLFLACFARDVRAEEGKPNWGRGPFEISDQFPFAVPHLSFISESPEVAGAGITKARSNFLWSNTHDRVSGFFEVDAEVRTLELSLAHGVSETTELKLHVPLVWEGGGVLDSFIFGWHDFFNLPQGPRNEPGVEDDRYEVFGRTSGSRAARFKDEGVRFGNTVLQGKHLFTAGSEITPAVSGEVSLALPTGYGDYGQNLFDAGASLYSAKRWDSWILYGGAGYLFYGDPAEEGLRYKRHRGAGFMAVEYEALSFLSVIFTFQAATNYIDNVPRFPDYETYLDFGLKTDITKNCVIEGAVRENPEPDQGTTDITFYLALQKRFGAE